MCVCVFVFVCTTLRLSSSIYIYIYITSSESNIHIISFMRNLHCCHLTTTSICIKVYVRIIVCRRLFAISCGRTPSVLSNSVGTWLYVMFCLTRMVTRNISVASDELLGLKLVFFFFF